MSIKEVRTDPSKTRSWLGDEERKDREREECPGEGSVQEEEWVCSMNFEKALSRREREA